MANIDPYGATQIFPGDRHESSVDAALEFGSSECPQLIGRYRLKKILGAGGFGLVYLAHDEQLDRPVAIKVPHATLVSKFEDAEAYLTEARTVAKLDHPHIVPVHDVGSTDECPCYIVSKYIEGTNLSSKLKQARLTYAEAAELVATVAEALHYAHKQGLVHRDIKTGNILVGTDGKPYVVDFGLALREENIGKGPGYVGTPAYMSPEQARGEGHRIDGRSDIFSLGVVLYELLTGRRPFKADSVEELLEQIATVEARPCRQIDDAIPKELERICLKSLSKRASERYSTAKDMADDLRYFLVASNSETTSTATGRHGKEAGVATPIPTPTTLPDSVSRPVKIVPKGLRSFDAGDSEFFIELLPGPRDRDGLPDSIRFWKTRIETTDADATYAVGLIYGPSGCGKSSLVKAGLLPRLAKSVTAVYIEATAEDTEARLLRVLRRQVANLPGDLGLIESLAALRQGQFLETGQNVLVVLDQFEQWLHAKRNEENTELVQALRHCDGGRLRCLVMVRDDFWLAVSRCMKSMEVEILEGRNSALVDLFDPIHARKVLTAFGRAYGRLSDNLDECSNEQNSFLDQAVAGLTQEGKVISVRLALFAEMVKGKPWTLASLKEVGGAEGVGVTFLEETFSATAAPPEHRYHQKAARAVLKALLPEPGADIKGHMRAQQDLLKTSGYANRPKDFANLIRILDGELRLITPTDLEGKDDAAPSATLPDAKYYQLSHDYLVPALLEWLTRKQKATRRGRAELRLADWSALWNARRENRHLPSWWEWVSILLFTKSKDWTPPQRKMMGRAARNLAVRGALLTACLALLLWGGWESFGRLRAQGLMDNLLHAQTVDAPAVVRNMAAYRRWLIGPLRNMHAEAEATGDERKQLHTSLALLPVDDGQVPYLLSRLLAGNPQEVAAIRTVLEPHASALREQMWKILEDRQADPNQRLRAACFLAAYDSDDGRWNNVSSDVATRLVTENALLLKEWADALRPVGHAILPALATLVSESRGPNDRRTLAGLYAEVAAGVADGFGPLEGVLSEKPRDGEAARVNLARRQATAAAALAAAGRWDKVWPLLRHTPNPTLRSYLIERLGTGGAAQAVMDRLNSDQERDVSARRALILVIGVFGDDQLPAGERERMARRLLEIYRVDPDPGIHATAGWLLEQWGHKERVQAIDRELATGSVDGQKPWYVTRQGQTMVVVPPGEIESTDQSGERRIVRVERPFALASREITLDEFLRFRVNHAADRQTARTGDCPVNEVSWYDAAAYCNWLSHEEGLGEDQWCYAPNEEGRYAAGMKVKANSLSLTGYRLPTVQEWEYACRAGSVTYWSMGDANDVLDRYAWFMTNAGIRSHPVGSLRPNDLGLFDLNGNVWEWCHDRFDDRGVKEGSKPEMADPVDGDSYRALRGGTFLNDSMGVGSVAEIRNQPFNHTGADGFRVARTIR